MSNDTPTTDRTVLVLYPGQCCEGFCVGDLLHDLRSDQADRLVEVLAERDVEVRAEALRAEHEWLMTAYENSKDKGYRLLYREGFRAAAAWVRLHAGMAQPNEPGLLNE